MWDVLPFVYVPTCRRLGVLLRSIKQPRGGIRGRPFGDVGRLLRFAVADAVQRASDLGHRLARPNVSRVSGVNRRRKRRKIRRRRTRPRLRFRLIRACIAFAMRWQCVRIAFALSPSLCSRLACSIRLLNELVVLRAETLLIQPVASARRERSQHHRFHFRPLVGRHARPARERAIVVWKGSRWSFEPRLAQQQDVRAYGGRTHRLNLAIRGKVLRVKLKIGSFCRRHYGPSLVLNNFRV